LANLNPAVILNISASPARTSSPWSTGEKASPATSGRLPRRSGGYPHRPHHHHSRVVQDVQFTLVLTVALVVMVIFLFLRSFRATIIPASLFRFL